MRRFVLVVSAAVMIGACNTPPVVIEVHRKQRQALEASRAYRTAKYRAALQDLRARMLVALARAYAAQVKEHPDVLTKGAGSLPPLSEAVATIDDRIQKHRAEYDADPNARIADRLYRAVHEYLTRSGLSREDRERLLKELGETASEIARSRTKEEGDAD